MFIEYLDDAYEQMNIGYGKFYASDILKNCDPIAYRIALSEFIDNLADNADIYVEGQTDSKEYGYEPDEEEDEDDR
jgi:hypothetical protein